MKALIDIEIIIHRELSKADETSTPATIIDACVRRAWEWRGLAGNCEPVLCISDNNFRKVIAPFYKAHRPPSPDHYKEVLAGLKQRMPHRTIHGLEADDVMGILQTSEVYGPTAIISIDKDMKTIPGRLVNPDKLLESGVVTEDEANYNWMYQTLVGDTADGFKGCPRVGPVKAENALDGLSGSLTDMWAVVVALFAESNSEESPLLNARLARILRRDDYDHEAGTIKLWHPEEHEIFDLEKMEVV